MKALVLAVAMLALTSTSYAAGVYNYGWGYTYSGYVGAGFFDKGKMEWSENDYYGGITGVNNTPDNGYTGSFQVEQAYVGDIVGDGSSWTRPVIHMYDIYGDGGSAHMAGPFMKRDGAEHTVQVTFGITSGDPQYGIPATPFAWWTIDGGQPCIDCTAVTGWPNHYFYADSNGVWVSNWGVGAMGHLVQNFGDNALFQNPSIYQYGGVPSWQNQAGFFGYMTVTEGIVSIDWIDCGGC